jgi:hypothetical protein
LKKHFGAFHGIFGLGGGISRADDLAIQFMAVCPRT